MENIWEQFDKAIDVDALKKEIESADTGSAYKEVPVGEYEVNVQKMELRASKKGDPMVTIWFKIISGEYQGSMIFMNQVLTMPFHYKIVEKVLSALAPGVETSFKSFKQYGNMIEDIFELIHEQYEFALKYGENKGFPTFEILDVFNGA